MWINKEEYMSIHERLIRLESNVRDLKNEVTIYPEPPIVLGMSRKPISISQAFYVLINGLGVKFIHTSRCESWEIEKKDAV